MEFIPDHRYLHLPSKGKFVCLSTSAGSVILQCLAIGYQLVITPSISGQDYQGETHDLQSPRRLRQNH
jgi:hypothetical protein